MAKKMYDRMSTHYTEATGLRVIGMYVQEFFHWGWQEHDQKNDDGIDGEIIPRYRDGRDMGIRIFVQSKCGPSYISSIKDGTVNISPYNNKKSLEEHLNKWKMMAMPVILIFTNAEKTSAKGYKLKFPTPIL